MVWNIKAQEKRVVHLVPRDDWGGAGLLGVTIRLDNYGGAEERMVRVLDVQPHSPAAGEYFYFCFFCFGFCLGVVVLFVGVYVCLGLCFHVQTPPT